MEISRFIFREQLVVNNDCLPTEILLVWVNPDTNGGKDRCLVTVGRCSAAHVILYVLLFLEAGTGNLVVRHHVF